MAFHPSSRNGYLTVPAGATIHTMPEPSHTKTRGVSRLFTSWSDDKSNPMFTKDTLDVSDIHQGSIGDCWFLAGAAAIIDHDFGSMLIKSCLIDCEDGWVIVRLFDGNLQPVYIRTKKSRASFMGRKYGVTGVSKTGFWCAALEKAAACFTKASNRCQIDVNNPSMKNTATGRATEAYRMLLGCETTDIPLANLGEGGAQSDEDTWNALMTNWNVGVPPNGAQVLQSVFGGSVSVEQWKVYRPKIRTAVALAKSANNPAAVNAAGVPQQVNQAIAGFITTKGLWSKSGYSGSGTYSAQANDLFRTITAKIAGDCPVGFLTQENVGRRERRGHSGGESMSRGMAGKHVYAILDTFSETVLARRKYIKACNPWGTYGRTYKDADDGAHPQLQPVEQENGVFWMELTDFCNLATMLYVGSPIDIDTLLRCL